MLVSIIINNYNYGRFLSEAIDSALSQTYPHTEVVVVDDGSTDNSRDIIASYGDRVISVLKENGGQASAFNAGFATSRGDVICFLDSDDIFLPEKVAKVVNVFNEYQDIGWCFHTLSLINISTGETIKHKDSGSSRECDFRTEIKTKGKLAFLSPATSGLCFKRSLLDLILPMPEAERVSIGDHYLKLTSPALSKGFFLDRELALQKLHGDNAYTLRNDKQHLKARINVLTAHWMKINFPMLAKFTNKLFALGVGIYWRTGGVEKEYKEIAKTYLSSVSLSERLEINCRAVYHYLRNLV